MKIILAKMIRTMAVICTIIVQIDLASKWHTIFCYKICTRPGQTTARATMQVDTAQATSHITKKSTQHNTNQNTTPRVNTATAASSAAASELANDRRRRSPPLPPPTKDDHAEAPDRAAV